MRNRVTWMRLAARVTAPTTGTPRPLESSAWTQFGPAGHILSAMRKLDRLHYAWVILAVTCLTVVLTAGVTAVPAVLIHPLEVAFGWDRAAIALAVSINVFLYGLAGPFAGRLMLTANEIVASDQWNSSL